MTLFFKRTKTNFWRFLKPKKVELAKKKLFFILFTSKFFQEKFEKIFLPHSNQIFSTLAIRRKKNFLEKKNLLVMWRNYVKKFAIEFYVKIFHHNFITTKNFFFSRNFFFLLIALKKLKFLKKYDWANFFHFLTGPLFGCWPSFSLANFAGQVLWLGQSKNLGHPNYILLMLGHYWPSHNWTSQFF